MKFKSHVSILILSILSTAPAFGEDCVLRQVRADTALINRAGVIAINLHTSSQAFTNTTGIKFQGSMLLLRDQLMYEKISRAQDECLAIDIVYDETAVRRDLAQSAPTYRCGGQFPTWLPMAYVKSILLVKRTVVSMNDFAAGHSCITRTALPMSTLSLE
jgi:hypothetical protein